MQDAPSQDVVTSPTGATDVPPPEPPSADEAVSLVVDKLEGWGTDAFALLPNLALALVVLIVFWLIGRLVRSGFDIGLRRTPLAQPIRNLLLTAVGLSVLGAGALIALSILGLDRTVTSLLAGVGILGLALGFAFQDIAANFMAGVLLSVRRPIRVGEVIETQGLFGTVEEIDLRSTNLRTPTGQLVFVPNRKVFESVLTNYSRLGRRRVDLAVGVSYGDDLETAREVVLKAVEPLPQRLAGEEPELFYEEFGASSINMVVRFWIRFERQTDYLRARSDAVVAVKSALDDAGITIPFPIRTLDFGIVGGRSLAESLAEAGSADQASSLEAEPSSRR